jgi:protein-disulfide isomerase
MQMRPMDVLTTVTALGAIVVCSLAIWDRIDPPNVAVRADRQLRDWQGLFENGHWVWGSASSTVRILEFGDYECPACKAFNRVVEQVMPSYGEKVSLYYRHWPLSYHANAYGAARAAECAGGQGAFRAYHSVLISDGVALGNWQEAAAVAGVADAAAFRACVLDNAPVPSIEKDLVDVDQLNSTGTPTIVVNGTLLGTVPDSAKLASILDAALADVR